MTGRGHNRSSEDRALKLLAMLEDPTTSFAEAGRRLGISRERVRQVAGQYGCVTGRQRQQLRREGEAGRVRAEITSAIPILGVLEFEIEPVRLGHGGKLSRVSRRQFDVNGHRCVTRSVFTSEAVRREFGPDYVVLSSFRGGGRVNKHVEFVLYHLPPGYPSKGWLIIPAKEAPYHNSVVKLGPPRDTPQAQAAYTGKWLNYLNAWHYLRGENSLQTPPEAA
jgi:hypothetical protein